METYLLRLPKTELHLHLEGSIRPARFLQLARKYETEYEDRDENQLRQELFHYTDFAHFLNVYRIVCEHLRSPEDYLALLWDLQPYFEQNNIRYAEVIYAPAIPWRFGRDGRDILIALLEAAGKLSAKGVQLRWILDCVRQFGPESAEQTAQLAAEQRESGVVALGLAGDENARPAADFEQVFNWARANNLHTHVHAGETGGPQQIWDALQILGANRIGHGIQAARDPALMAYLRDHAIALDICLTSNVATRAWRPLSDNPFGLLYRRGIPVTLSTDDPGLFDTTLQQEYRKAAQAFSLDLADLARIALQGVRSAFLPHAEKMQLMQSFQNEIAELKSVYSSGS